MHLNHYEYLTENQPPPVERWGLGVWHLSQPHVHIRLYTVSRMYHVMNGLIPMNDFERTDSIFFSLYKTQTENMGNMGRSTAHNTGPQLESSERFRCSDCPRFLYSTNKTINKIIAKIIRRLILNNHQLHPCVK